MADKKEPFEKALEGKKIPILVLDNKWHRLFDTMESDKTMGRLEEELSRLLKRQGKLNTELKDIRRIKKKLMEDIVELMDREDSASVRKREENKRLIEECNEKSEAYEDELLELPGQIQKLNHELMIHTMELCYYVLKKNEKDIVDIATWINQVRVELKKNILRKQEKEVTNQKLYSFMHDILGPDVIEIFDMQYNPMEQGTKKKGEQE